MVITLVFNATQHFESKMNVTKIEVSELEEDWEAQILNYSLERKKKSS